MSDDTRRALPSQDATVTVSYWTLDCFLDWAAHQDLTDPWTAERHYDELRAAQAADAVGRERVSEATVRVCFAEIETLAINSVQEWAAADPVAGRRLNASEKIRRLNEAKDRWIRLLTAAPPERHDAPGVSVPADMLLNWRRVVNFAIQQVADEEWQSQLNGVMRQMSELTRELRRHAVYPALTGQPDAGRDPDAADAGGGAE